MEKENGRNSKMYKTVTNMKDSTRMIRKMDMESLIGRVAIFTEETMLMMRERGTVKCTGLMDQFTKENGKKEFNMEWDK